VFTVPDRLNTQEAGRAILDVLGLLAALLRDDLKALFARRIREQPAGTTAVPSAERSGRLSALVARKRECEAREEQLVLEAEAANLDVDRRPDVEHLDVLLEATT